MQPTPTPSKSRAFSPTNQPRAPPEVCSAATPNNPNQTSNKAQTFSTSHSSHVSFRLNIAANETKPNLFGGQQTTQTPNPNQPATTTQVAGLFGNKNTSNTGNVIDESNLDGRTVWK